jgi:integrase
LQLKERQEGRIRKLGDRYTNDGFVFANWWGRPYFRRSYIRTFKESLKLAGLSKTVRFYDLRHTAATLLLQAGVNIKVVSERLGHASVTVTLEAYIHVLPEMPHGTGERIEALLEGHLEDTDTP